MFGPRAISFGAVAVFVSSSHLDQVVHLPELSKTVSTCWVQVGTHIFGGFSIPPRRRGINEALRLDAVSVLFTEYDQAAKFLASPDAAVHIAGDVNPGDDIDATFAEELRKRGLCHSFDETTPTHAKGRRLDAVCSRPKSALSPPQVHNGGHCKTTGCTSPICGRRKETFQSADLDHDPVSWATMADASDPPCVWRVKWNSDLGKWHAAETAFASPVLELVTADLDTNLRSSRLEDLTQKEAVAIVDSIAVVWRTCLIMTGATAGLASVPGTKGRHQSSPEVAAAHRAFMNALRACRHGKASREDVTTARREWRAAATNDRAQQRLDVQECILEAASRNEQQVATVLKRLNAKPDHGLPAYMLDPLDANNVLVGITDVLDGAKRYIEARGNPIREKYWDADHTKTIETKLRTIRGTAHQSLQTWSTDELISASEYIEALSRISEKSACWGLPYAAILAGETNTQTSHRLLCGLIIRLCCPVSPWLPLHTYHKLKKGRARTSSSSYRELALGVMEGRIFEDIWFVRCGHMVKAAWGDLQDGGGDVLAASLIDLETHAIRRALDLPSADLHTDRREAFDSQWPDGGFSHSCRARGHQRSTVPAGRYYDDAAQTSSCHQGPPLSTVQAESRGPRGENVERP